MGGYAEEAVHKKINWQLTLSCLIGGTAGAVGGACLVSCSSVVLSNMLKMAFTAGGITAGALLCERHLPRATRMVNRSVVAFVLTVGMLLSSLLAGLLEINVPMGVRARFKVLVDVSGSMGDVIDTVDAVLKKEIGSMPEHTSMRIIKFADSAEDITEGYLGGTISLKEGGGTDISNALSAAFDGETEALQVLIITDMASGEVVCPVSIPDGSRIFVLYIDSSAVTSSKDSLEQLVGSYNGRIISVDKADASYAALNYNIQELGIRFTSPTWQLIIRLLIGLSFGLTYNYAFGGKQRQQLIVSMLMGCVSYLLGLTGASGVLLNIFTMVPFSLTAITYDKIYVQHG